MERYRVGGKIPTNIYVVTPQNPDGVYIGHACAEADAALIVEALNNYRQAGETSGEGRVEGADDAGAGA